METQLLHQYFKLTEQQAKQFEQAFHLYHEWNQKINMISRKNMEHLVSQHFLHSLAIAKFTSFTAGTKILDIGTGGGFPGIPLAIMFPEVDFVLADSIAKKIKVVQTVADALSLQNVKATAERAENINEKFDFIISRAVTAFPKFVGFCQNKFSKQSKNGLENGIIYLKGGDFEEEVKPFRNAEVYPITQYFDGEFFETKKIIYLPM
ncbi:MAG: 16S rRNA (guanine(527)-N(7))-methyltransferase RsmG [Bacteroidales bacterium]|nr:16S rRNA (guanine(527)-N(7))-methyltransferase RsmG [Bacteroidales bacterium]